MVDLRKSGSLFKVLLWVLFSGFVFSINSLAAESAKQGAKELYDVDLAADNIKYLRIKTENGSNKVFTDPGNTIKLPKGEHVLIELRLKNGFSKHVSSRPKFKAGEDAPNEIKAGQGLKAVIKAERKGSFLELNYELRDAQGNRWGQRSTKNPPSFTVYKNGTKLVSHDFQYG